MWSGWKTSFNDLSVCKLPTSTVDASVQYHLPFHFLTSWSRTGMLFRCANSQTSSLHLRILSPWNWSSRCMICLASSDSMSSDKALCVSATHHCLWYRYIFMFLLSVFLFRVIQSICSSLAAAQMDFFLYLTSLAALSRTLRGGLYPCLFYICVHKTWWCLLCNNNNTLLSSYCRHDTLQKYYVLYIMLKTD